MILGIDMDDTICDTNENVIVEADKYDKEVYMTVNKDETFKGYLNDGVLQKDSISFFDEGLASDILSESLPNAWAYYTGNIWDILTNSVAFFEIFSSSILNFFNKSSKSNNILLNLIIFSLSNLL